MQTTICTFCLSIIQICIAIFTVIPDELQNTLRTLEYIQTHSTVRLGEDLNVPLRFSLGYALLDGTADTQRLFKEADERMYANKRERKQQNNA